MKPKYRYYIYVFLAAAIVAVFLHMLKSPATDLNPVVHQPKATTLFFGGDIMLSRKVGSQIRQNNDNSLPFNNIATAIKSHDLSFANLESPFSDTGPIPTAEFTFKAEPETIAGLKSAGFSVLSTANNHTLDQGQHGIEYTLSWLKQNNITPVGTGVDCHQGAVITKNGIRFGFLAYTYGTNQGAVIPEICYTTDLTKMQKDIQTLRPQVDYLIVSAHMGVEYTRPPTKAQMDFAHTAIDAGADLMIGNHPHWIQTIEPYHGKWIFYAMGNLVFDQMWSTETTQGLTATLTFKDKTLSNIDLHPVIIENYCCPRWASETETKNILNEINLTSTSLFSTIR